MKNIGTVLALVGSVLSMTGALINNLMLDHVTAMWVWAISNLLFLAYFVGVDKGWWNGKHLSTRALIVTYAVFTVSNAWGLIHG